MRTLRYALLIRTCGKESITDLSEEDKTSLSELLKGVSVETVESLFNLILEGAKNIQRSFYPQMALELILIKLSTLDDIVPIQDIIKKLDTLSKSMGSSKQTAVRVDEPAQAYRSAPSPKQAPKLAEKIAATNIETKETAPVQAKTRLSVSKSTQDFIQFVKTTKPVIGRRLEQANEIVVEGSTVKIICETGSAESDYLQSKESQTALETLIREFFSDDTTLHIEEVSLETPESNKTKVEQKAEKKEKIKNDPVLKEAIDIFGGRVISIKPNNKE